MVNSKTGATNNKCSSEIFFRSNIALEILILKALGGLGAGFGNMLGSGFGTTGLERANRSGFNGLGVRVADGSLGFRTGLVRASKEGLGTGGNWLGTGSNLIRK